MSKVLIISTELLPTLPFPTVGGSQRTYSIGQALKEKGHEVIYSLPLEQLAGKEGVPEELMATTHSMLDIEKIVHGVAPDVIIFSAPFLARFISDPSVPVVMDLAANVELEAALAPGENLGDVLIGRLDQYRKGDFFILGNRRQLYWYSAFLLLSGINPGTDYFTIFPICGSPEMPVIPERNGLRFLSAGMFYPWQDPFDALNEVIAAIDKRGKGELHIFTGREHPGWASISSKLIDPKKRLNWSSRLMVHGILPFDQAMTEWGGYSCAVDVMKPNLERMLANPMRSSTYLWLGVPIIVPDFHWISGLVREYEAGWVVDPEKPGAVRDVVNRILDDPSVLCQRSRNAQKVVAENLTWDKRIDGLDKFCRSPRKLTKSDSLIGSFASEVARIYAENQETARNVGRMEGGLEYFRETSVRIAGELREREKETAYLRQRIDEILKSRTWRTAQFIRNKLLRMKTPDDSSKPQK